MNFMAPLVGVGAAYILIDSVSHLRTMERIDWARFLLWLLMGAIVARLCMVLLPRMDPALSISDHIGLHFNSDMVEFAAQLFALLAGARAVVGKFKVCGGWGRLTCAFTVSLAAQTFALCSISVLRGLGASDMASSLRIHGPMIIVLSITTVLGAVAFFFLHKAAIRTSMAQVPPLL